MRTPIKTILALGCILLSSSAGSESNDYGYGYGYGPNGGHGHGHGGEGSYSYSYGGPSGGGNNGGNAGSGSKGNSYGYGAAYLLSPPSGISLGGPVGPNGIRNYIMFGEPQFNEDARSKRSAIEVENGVRTANGQQDEPNGKVNNFNEIGKAGNEVSRKILEPQNTLGASGQNEQTENKNSDNFEVTSRPHVQGGLERNEPSQPVNYGSNNRLGANEADNDEFEAFLGMNSQGRRPESYDNGRVPGNLRQPGAREGMVSNNIRIGVAPRQYGQPDSQAGLFYEGFNERGSVGAPRQLGQSSDRAVEAPRKPFLFGGQRGLGNYGIGNRREFEEAPIQQGHPNEQRDLSANEYELGAAARQIDEPTLAGFGDYESDYNDFEVSESRYRGYGGYGGGAGQPGQPGGFWSGSYGGYGGNGGRYGGFGRTPGRPGRPGGFEGNWGGYGGGGGYGNYGGFGGSGSGYGRYGSGYGGFRNGRPGAPGVFGGGGRGGGGGK